MNHAKRISRALVELSNQFPKIIGLTRPEAITPRRIDGKPMPLDNLGNLPPGLFDIIGESRGNAGFITEYEPVTGSQTGVDVLRRGNPCLLPARHVKPLTDIRVFAQSRPGIRRGTDIIAGDQRLPIFDPVSLPFESITR